MTSEDELDVEALAAHLAWNDVHEHVTGEWWFGYPDPEKPEEMQASFESRLPRARETATRYAAILRGGSNQ